MERHSVYLGEKGRILLPAQLRKRFSLERGERLIASATDDGTITLIPAKSLAKRLKGSMKGVGGTVNQFLIHKRAEAKLELGK